MDVETTIMDKMNQPKRLTGFGQRLREAREKAKLTERDASARLHLKPHLIGIFEEEDFDNTLPKTFLRGHLRSYARLLNFNEDEIEDALTNCGLSAHVNNVLTSQKAKTTSYKLDRYLHWSTYIVTAVLLVLVGMWWQSHTRFTATDMAIAPVQQAEKKPDGVIKQITATPATSTEVSNPLMVNNKINDTAPTAGNIGPAPLVPINQPAPETVNETAIQPINPPANQTLNQLDNSALNQQPTMNNPQSIDNAPIENGPIARDNTPPASPEAVNPPSAGEPNNQPIVNNESPTQIKEEAAPQDLSSIPNQEATQPLPSVGTTQVNEDVAPKPKKHHRHWRHRPQQQNPNNLEITQMGLALPEPGLEP
jgi:cytoskeletal protein RodZ